MKKKNNTYIILLVLLIVLIIGGFFFARSRNNTLNGKQRVSSGLIPNVPNLEITVINYPKQINTYCDTADIELKVKNLGGEALTYQDLLDNKYQFRVKHESTSWQVWMKISVDENGGYYNSTMDDFGTVKPGEEKMLYIRSGSSKLLYYGDENQIALLSNILSSEMEMAGDNGDFVYTVEFVQVKDEKHHPRLAGSEPFTVRSNIYKVPGEPKDCPLIYQMK